IHQVPFDQSMLGGPIHPEQLPESAADSWMQTLGLLPLNQPSAEYVAEQARLLGLPTRMARSELHVVKPHQKVLELPGTGGELTLAGVIALEMGAPHSSFVTRVDVEDLRRNDHALRQRTFDIVIGLHPDKGGLFRIENQLAIWFPTAKVLLV